MVMQTKNEINITRVFDAPKSEVWKAWTEPEMLKQWWGPKEFTAPFSSIDLRVGGKYLSSMRGPDGKEYWSTGVYKEIVPESKLVMTDSFSDSKGNVVPATQYGMSAEFPRELQITVLFEDQGGSTKLTLKHLGMPVGNDSEMAIEGWLQSFDKLAALLAQSKVPAGT